VNREDATDLALEWAGRGLPAFPIAVKWDTDKSKTNKRPLTRHGFQDAVTEADVVRTLFERVSVPAGEDLGVGLWPGPPGYVVLDDDGGLKGSGIVLPPTYAPGSASGGRHYWYRKVDKELEISNHSPWTGIDVRADGGWVVAPGTEVVLKVGDEWATFAWHDPKDYSVALCPTTVWNRLKAGGSSARDGWEHYDPAKVHPLTAEAVEVFCTHLGGHHPRVVPGPPVHVQITRPEKRDGTSASIGFIGPGVTKVFSSNWPGLREGMVLSLAELTDVLEGRVPTTPSPGPVAQGLTLDAEVWEAREHLGVIRDAARARLVAPDAVLGSVLARTVAFCDFRIKLPPIVGSVAGLSLLVVLLGEPEAGKSAAWAVAAELMPKPSSIKVADDLKYGTGEGWIESLLESQEIPREEGDKGPKKYKKVQRLHHALAFIDEGSRLTVPKVRQTSSIPEALRSIFSDQALGESNASAETYRHVDRGQYVFGVGMGLQPIKAADLLAGSDAGDPQRWCWVWSHDPAYVAGSDWDGRALSWMPQTFEAHFGRQTAIGTGGFVRVLIDVPADIEAEVRQHRIDRLRNGTHDPLQAHVMLLRLKVAEAFALLDQRLDLNAEDWALAGAHVATSARVRTHAAEVIAERHRGSERAKRATRVESDVASADAGAEAEAQRAIAAGARAIARKVAREGRVVIRDAMSGVAGKHRKVADFEDMLAAAIGAGWVAVDGSELIAGSTEAP
jgi:hypothetical protein